MSKHLLVLDDTTKIFLFSIDEGDSLDCLDSVVLNLDDDGMFKGKDTDKVTGVSLTEEETGRKVESGRSGQAVVAD